jgi:hypothetical protein
MADISKFAVLVDQDWAKVERVDRDTEGHYQLFAGVGPIDAVGNLIWFKIADVYPWAGEVQHIFYDRMHEDLVRRCTMVPNINNLLLMAQCAYNNGLLVTAARLCELAQSSITNELPQA